MAKARRYVLTSEPTKAVRGQAAVVLDALRAHQETGPALASTITETVVASGNLKTKQDALRVVLYYIIVFKGRGLVAAHEDVPAAPSECELTDEQRAELDELENIEFEPADSVDRAEIALGVE